MAASPSKEATPASDAKSSDAAKTTTEKSLFTDKEERVLKAAWSCMKTGPPEIDLEKLTKLGGFNTQKTASNTWGVIKKKLLSMISKEDEVDGGEAEGTRSRPNFGAPCKGLS